MAHITGIWAIPTVYAMMTVQMIHMSKRLAAHITGIWTLFTVYPLRIFQVTLVIE
jgi:hypothetical protein